MDLQEMRWHDRLHDDFLQASKAAVWVAAVGDSEAHLWSL
jgi:hypothetical protein